MCKCYIFSSFLSLAAFYFFRKFSVIPPQNLDKNALKIKNDLR